MVCSMPVTMAGVVVCENLVMKKLGDLPYVGNHYDTIQCTHIPSRLKSNVVQDILVMINE